MIKNTNNLRGVVIALIAGAGFIILAVVYLDTESSALLGQLIGVFALIFILIGSAAFVAWFGRWLLRRISSRRSE